MGYEKIVRKYESSFWEKTNCRGIAWKSNDILKSSEKGLGKYWKSVQKCEQLISCGETLKNIAFLNASQRNWEIIF